MLPGEHSSESDTHGGILHGGSPIFSILANGKEKSHFADQRMGTQLVYHILLDRETTCQEHGFANTLPVLTDQNQGTGSYEASEVL